MQAAAHRKEIDTRAAKLAQQLDSAELRGLQDNIRAALKHYDESITRLEKSLKASEFDEALKFLAGEVARNDAAIEAARTEQVSKAMTEMDRVTQANAATAEESASVAHELSTQSVYAAMPSTSTTTSPAS